MHTHYANMHTFSYNLVRLLCRLSSIALKICADYILIKKDILSMLLQRYEPHFNFRVREFFSNAHERFTYFSLEKDNER